MEDRVHDLIVRQLGERLGITSVDPDDDLWELGMTSMDSVGLMVAVEDAFEVELPDDAMNRATFGSVRRIAGALGAALAAR